MIQLIWGWGLAETQVLKLPFFYSVDLASHRVNSRGALIVASVTPDPSTVLAAFHPSNSLKQGPTMLPWLALRSQRSPLKPMWNDITSVSPEYWLQCWDWNSHDYPQETLRRMELLPKWKKNRVHKMKHEVTHRLPSPRTYKGLIAAGWGVQFGGVTIIISPCSYKYCLISLKFL